MKLRLRLLLRLAAMVGVLWAILVPLASPASADVVYWTNTRDQAGKLVWTQPAYYPVKVIGRDLRTEDPKQPGKMVLTSLSGPKDLFVDAKNRLFVADTGNNRIVEFAPDGSFVRNIVPKGSPLNKPQGVFVNDQGELYIADTGNKRVVKLASDGTVLKEYKKPDSRFIPPDYKYDPTRIVVDKRGFLYIASLGGYSGLLQLDRDGQFQGFFGANRTQLSVVDSIKRLVYPEKMYANETNKVPGTVSSIAVDRDGFIYTTTSGLDIRENQVKKLNTRGNNMLEADESETGPLNFGAIRRFEAKNGPDGKRLQPQLADIAVSLNGNMTTIDVAYKYISQFDAMGNLLYFWGGPSSTATTQLGLFQSPVAVDVNSRNELFILDEQEGLVQVMRMTEFAEKVNAAGALTQQGKYEESEPLWQQVLHLNKAYPLAYYGMGKAAYKRGDYEAAMDYAERGGYRKLYSDSFWQIRLRWFQAHFSSFATWGIALIAGVMAAEKATRKQCWRLQITRRFNEPHSNFLRQLRHSLIVLRHPIDGFAALRYEQMGGLRSAALLYALAFISIYLIRRHTSFAFNSLETYKYTPGTVFLWTAAIIGGWIVSHYLISTIYRGEARFRDVLIGTAYAMVPIIMIGLPLTLLSYGMTLSEKTIYDFGLLLLIGWTALMVIWKVQSMQNYSFRETVMNLGLTIFTFFVMSVLALILFGLTSELQAFVLEIFREVRLR